MFAGLATPLLHYAPKADDELCYHFYILPSGAEAHLAMGPQLDDAWVKLLVSYRDINGLYTLVDGLVERLKRI